MDIKAYITSGILEDSEVLCEEGWDYSHPESAHAAPLLCDPSAREGSRPSSHSDDARARRSLHDPDLYARARGTPARGVRQVSSTGIAIGDWVIGDWVVGECSTENHEDRASQGGNPPRHNEKQMILLRALGGSFFVP